MKHVKRILSRQLVALLLAATMAVSASALIPAVLPKVPVLSDILGIKPVDDDTGLQFRCGDVDGKDGVTIFDALEILKKLVNMDSAVDGKGLPADAGAKAALKARRAALLTTESRDAAKALGESGNPNTVSPSIFDALEILKVLVNMSGTIKDTCGEDGCAAWCRCCLECAPFPGNIGKVYPNCDCEEGNTGADTGETGNTGETGDSAVTGETGNTGETGDSGGSTPPQTDPSTPPQTPPSTPPQTPPSTPPQTPPSTPPQTPPSTPPQTDPITGPQTPPSTPPQTDPITEPQTPPSTPPQTDPITEPQTPPSTPPQTDPITGPQTPPSTPPQTDPITEPQTDPITEPQTDPITEPQTDPITEPQTDPITEPDTTAEHVCNVCGVCGGCKAWKQPLPTECPGGYTRCICFEVQEGHRPVHIPRPQDMQDASINDGVPTNPVVLKNCAYPGCTKTNVEVCPRCTYCRDCDWMYFGTVHCPDCGFGTDCIASELSNNTDRLGRNDWCGEHNKCQICCGDYGDGSDHIFYKDGGLTLIPVSSGRRCVFDGDPHGTCNSPTEIVACSVCATGSERFDMCVQCIGVRYGVVVCNGCNRHSDCVSSLQSNGFGGTRADGWCKTCGKCKVSSPTNPSGCCPGH